MPFFGSGDAIQAKAKLRQRYELVIMPLLSGKSRLQSELSKYQGAKRVIPFDADALATAIVAGNESLQKLDTASNMVMLETMLYSKLEDQFLEFLKTLPNDVAICITSNIHFCDWLQIKDKRVSVFLPSADLYSTMVAELTAADGAESARIFQKSRDQILDWAHRLEVDPKYNVYGSLADIVKVISEKFGLKLSAY